MVSVATTPGGKVNQKQSEFKVNQKQSEFIERAMQQLTQVMNQCAENSATATAILGRRQVGRHIVCLLYTSPSPRDQRGSRMPSSA